MPSLSDLFPTKINNTIVNDKILTMLAESCSTQAERNNMSNGAGEPFISSTNMSLTNAVVSNGYCANTTSFVVGSNKIPVLTSNTSSTACIVSESSNLGSGTTSGGFMFGPAWRTADNIANSGWLSSALPTTSVPQWIKHAFSETTPIKQYAITANQAMTAMDNPYAYPTAWKLQGSNDDSTWDDLNSQSGISFTAYQRRLFTLTSTVNYLYYRLYITASNGTSYTCVTAFELISPDATSANIATITLNEINVTEATAGKIIFTGYNTDAILGADNLLDGTQTWTSHGSLPTAGTRGSSTISDGTYVYLIGGYGSSSHTTVYRALLADIRTATQTWEAWGALPTASGYTMAIIADDTYVYILGGFGTANYTTVYRTTWVALQAGTQTWTSHGNLPTTSLSNAAVIADDTYVYIVGGFSTSDYSTVYRTTWTALKAGTQTWTSHGNLPTATCIGTAVFTDGTYVYALGGRYGVTNYTTAYRTTLVALQAGTQTWSAWGILPSSPALVLSVILDGNNIYVIGGFNNSVNYTTIYKAFLNTMDGTPLDVGNTGTNKVEVYSTINGVAGNALAFVSESLGDNKWRFTSDEFSLTNATTYGMQFKSFARNTAPNFRIYEALFIWRTGEVTVIGSSSDNYEAALYANLLAMASQQSADYSMPNGRLWACADATNLTLTNAVIENGYARNTIVEAISGTNLVPTMTSNTTPSGVASASSVYSSTYAAWRAFNKVSTGTDYWASPAGAAMPQWLRYDFTQATTIYGYRIVKGLLFSGWIFQGSNDGTTWVDLDTQSGQDFTGGLTLTYVLQSSANYSKYRLYITTASDVNVGMYELELLSAPTEQSINPATIIGNNYSLTGATAGRLIIRAYNADATEALDIGNTGTNKINLCHSIDGNTTWNNALAIESVESLGDNLYRYTTTEFDLSSAIGIGFKLQSDNVNFRLLDVLTIWRDEV